MAKREIIGNATLYLGDSLEIIHEINSADAVITDPVYGVLLGEAKNQQKYEGFSDTPEYVRDVCVPIIETCIKISKQVLVTPGNRNMFLYPQPDDMGVWWNPAGTSRGKWGYQCASPIFYYGKDPRAGKGSTPSSMTAGHDRQTKPDHPCPKPLGFMKKLVHKGSLDGETVLDPFMGSGTTGVACMELRRKFIGIDIVPKYFDIACKRIEEAQRQTFLFPAEIVRG